jgi:hypothetical protein
MTTTALPPDTDEAAELVPDDETAEMGGGPGFTATLIREGVRVEDGRLIRPGGLVARPCPLPLMASWTTEDDHGGAALVGRIDRVTRADDGTWTCEGTFDTGPVAAEAARLVAAGMLRGLSVDTIPGDVEVHVSAPEAATAGLGVWKTFTEAERRALAKQGKALPGGGCPIENEAQLRDAIRAVGRATNPAAAKAHIKRRARALGLTKLIPEGWAIVVSGDAPAPPAEEEAEAEGTSYQQSRAQVDLVTATLIGATLVPHPAWDGATLTLTGEPPAETEAEEDIGEGEPVAAAAHPADCADCAAMRAAAQTAAAAGPSQMPAAAAPPADWFTDPHLDRPTPLTVTADGRVFGHAARWNVCHRGIAGRCVTAPRSAAGYAHFRTGSVVTDDGTSVATGPLTVGTGHATLAAGARDAAAHYDHTGTAVADVACGEDAHGIWVAGCLRPGVSPEQVWALRASALSGDWRPIGGRLELVALLAVNTPGFTIAASAAPEVAWREHGQQVTALVAAGATAPPAPVTHADLDALAAEVARLRTLTRPLLGLAAAAARQRLTA